MSTTNEHRQQSMVTLVEQGDVEPGPLLGIFQGREIRELPTDLFIPPEALKVFLDSFEGPLDLLLFLIKKQNLDILNIPVADITRQYVQYIQVMNELDIDLAAEYLVMAAMLAEIKSRMLLPRPEALDEEEDPRADLMKRLLEYERFKQAAEDMQQLDRVGRDIFVVKADVELDEGQKQLPKVVLDDLLNAFQDVLDRTRMYAHHHVEMEKLDVRAKMGDVLNKLNQDSFCEFAQMFRIEEGRFGVVVTFLAILELIKESLIDVVQNQEFGVIHLKSLH